MDEDDAPRPVRNPDTIARGHYIRKANLPTRAPVWDTLDQFPAEYRGRVVSWLDQVRRGEKGDGVGMLFTGKPGTGKTTIAANALRHALLAAPRQWLGKCYDGEAALPGYFIEYPSLVALHHRSFGQGEDPDEAQDMLDSLYGRAFQHWRNTRLLVVDDVGREHNSGQGTYHASVLHDLLRSRWHRGYYTILTTNTALDDQFKALYGDATYSFIFEGFDIVKTQGGKDWRRHGG